MKPSTLLLRMNALSRFAFMATVLLVPLFFTPYFASNLFSVKGALLTIGVTVSVLAYAIARFVDGELSFPKTRINLAVLLIVLTTAISAVFSPSFYKSVFGLSFEMGSLASIVSLALLYFMGIQHTSNEKYRNRIVSGIYVSFIASFLVVVASLFLGKYPYFVSIFKGISGGTVAGSWTDYGVVSATVVMLSMCYSALGGRTLIKSIGRWLTIVMGLLVLALVNIPALWIIVGSFALLFFVYTVSLSHKPGQIENTEKQHRLPVTAFLIVVVCILFTVGNSFVGSVLSTKLGFVSDFVQPSATATVDIYKGESSNITHAIVGVGPNRFSEAWMRFKPVGINNTVYWDTVFSSGFGSVLTALVTTGILGFIAWVFFFFIYFVTGIRVLLAQLKTEFFDSALVTTFFISAFLWVTHMFISTNITVFVLAFTTTTLFIGALVSRNVIEVSTNTYLKDPRNSFFAILLLVCIMIGSIVSLYFSVVKVVSVVYFTKGTQATSVESAQNYVNKAIQLEQKNDVYYRTLSSLYLSQVGTLISESKDPSTIQSTVQALVNAAQTSGTKAVSIDTENYSNWLALGQFFETATSLQMAGEPYKNGVTSYEKVAYYVPNSPAVPLAQARLELANKNMQATNEFINRSLELKPDYIAAYQLKAQMAFNDKDYKGAIDQLSQAIKYNPTVADLYVSRGVLLSQTGNPNDATNDFRTAFTLSPNQNTGYLLAQADIKNGNTEEATTIVDALLKLSPDNADFKDLKEKIQQSKNPAPVVSTNTDSKKVETKNKK
ncbi:MAG: tetratricopeptide repeat protein [Minisyncoccia bacterium]